MQHVPVLLHCLLHIMMIDLMASFHLLDCIIQYQAVHGSERWAPVKPAHHSSKSAEQVLPQPLQTCCSTGIGTWHL